MCFLVVATVILYCQQVVLVSVRPLVEQWQCVGMAMAFSIDLAKKRKLKISDQLDYYQLSMHYRTTFVITAYRSCPDTNVQTLADAIKHTLIEVKNSFMTSNL